MFIREGFTAAELADIDQHMQATRLEGYKRLSRGGGFCTGSTCYTAVPDVADCTCGGASHLDSNCTCDYSPEVVIRNVQTAQGQSDSAVLVQQPYPYEFHSPDGGPYQVGCGGPAVVQSTESDPTRVPHSVQLSCLPGTGTMTVDFASFGLPAIGGNTPAVRPGTGIRTANCSSFVTNSSCDAGPAVLKQLKALCDGKQSCRLNTSPPVFTRPTSGACGDVPLSDLKLAVRATGCQFGTGSGVVFNFRERLAMFLLARGDHWWMGTGWIANYAPVMLPEWEVDYGTPEGNLTVGADGVITRRWSKMDVSLDTNTFEATFEPRSEAPAVAAAAAAPLPLLLAPPNAARQREPPPPLAAFIGTQHFQPCYNVSLLPSLLDGAVQAARLGSTSFKFAIMADMQRMYPYLNDGANAWPKPASVSSLTDVLATPQLQTLLRNQLKTNFDSYTLWVYRPGESDSPY